MADQVYVPDLGCVNLLDTGEEYYLIDYGTLNEKTSAAPTTSWLTTNYWWDSY